MGVGALAFAALEAFGQEAIEYAQDEEVKVGNFFWVQILISNDRFLMILANVNYIKLQC